MKYSVSYILAQKFAPLGRQYTILDDDLSTLVYLDNGPEISLDELTAADLELQAIEYRNLRAKEYPAISDQLDMLWASMNTGEIQVSKAFYEACKTVKDKYPKPVK